MIILKQTDDQVNNQANLVDEPTFLISVMNDKRNKFSQSGAVALYNQINSVPDDVTLNELFKENTSLCIFENMIEFESIADFQERIPHMTEKFNINSIDDVEELTDIIRIPQSKRFIIVASDLF